jgi:hypothetical protein
MIRISDPSSTAFVSDWIELYVAVTGEFISKTKLSQLLERDTGEVTLPHLLYHYELE